MHHHTFGISSLLHSVNLILFTLLLVHLILRISPHYSHHLRSHHLSLTQSFTPDSKLISFTNPFPWTAFTDLELGPELLGKTLVCFNFFSSHFVSFLVTFARLSGRHHHFFQSTLNSPIVSYGMQLYWPTLRRPMPEEIKLITRV